MRRSGRHMKGMGRKLNRIKRRMEYSPFEWGMMTRHAMARLWHNCRWYRP